MFIFFQILKYTLYKVGLLGFSFLSQKCLTIEPSDNRYPPKIYTVFKLKIAATRQVWYGSTDADWHTDITILALQKGKIGPWTTSLTWTTLPSKTTRLSKVISIISPWNKCVNCDAFKQTWIPFAQKYFCVKFDSCQSFFFQKSY